MNVSNANTLIEFAKKKKSNVRTCLNGANNATGASQTFDSAKVQINSEITKQKLEKGNYIGVSTEKVTPIFINPQTLLQNIV